MTGWFEWLENSPWAAGIRQSAWLYPALEIVHITGIVLLVGPAIMFDIRLLGWSRKIPVTLLEQYLLVWSRRALWLIVPSGLLLFITNATALAADRVFHIKLILLVVAALNAYLFHKITLPYTRKSESTTDTTVAAKSAAIISIVVWIGIIACGRLLAY